jgi:hypothetical protein
MVLKTIETQFSLSHCLTKPFNYRIQGVNLGIHRGT